MFPGQGSQQVGMGQELLEIYPNLLINEFEEALNWSLQEIMLTSDKEEITKTNIAQPYIFAISYCYGLEAIRKLGNPSVAIGHSLGEYTALALGEYLSFSDALKIISVRGEAMQKAVENSGTTMAAVLSSELEKTIHSVEELKAQGIDINISNYNDATQIVISGKYEDIDYLKSNAKALNAKRVIPLDVAGAFHSPVVTPAKKKVMEVLENIDFKQGKFDVYMNVDAQLVELSSVKERLTNQIDNSVLFHKQIVNIEKEENPEYWYHIGPGNVTAGMVKKSISSEGIGIINSLDSLNIF
jgi:[acyl-carrier-protein] S-malonyltransferase